ncbi:hypothetical protein LB516_16165 [Mesorhizobium sp. CO1-1-7]|uniref:hypothetical protein n=1 Tax=Mesorhizobium sp. CO1-1-7 TaxID=2876632 RepID=UPI001CD0CC5F|nr:hypothetical protein [Mesorhizobium sp. CO1-1-7]MBZ9746787.1 hypothetical protein [Mesorhizobium sp. CO1-1-7]
MATLPSAKHLFGIIDHILEEPSVWSLSFREMNEVFITFFQSTYAEISANEGRASVLAIQAIERAVVTLDELYEMVRAKSNLYDKRFISLNEFIEGLTTSLVHNFGGMIKSDQLRFDTFTGLLSESTNHPTVANIFYFFMTKGYFTTCTPESVKRLVSRFWDVAMSAEEIQAFRNSGKALPWYMRRVEKILEERIFGSESEFRNRFELISKEVAAESDVVKSNRILHTMSIFGFSWENGASFQTLATHDHRVPTGKIGALDGGEHSVPANLSRAKSIMLGIVQLVIRPLFRHKT